MKFIRQQLIFIMLALGSACVDPLQVNVDSVQKKLIVDGFISDQPGPYRVKLFYTLKLGTSVLVPFELATNALVQIGDNEGNVTQLVEAEAGVYETDPVFKTVVGRSYHISITTGNGKSYQSSPQRLMVSGAVKDIHLKFNASGLPGNSSGEIIGAINISVDGSGVDGSDNLFRWRWYTIYKAMSFPQLRTRTTPGGEIPIPEECSGYIYASRQLVQVGPCTCCICWSYNYSNLATVSKKELVSDYEFHDQELESMPVTSMNFYDRYFIEVQQLTLTEEAYTYWDLVQKQQGGSANIFQPSAIKIKGNIDCITDPDEEVLGFFEVSGVVSHSLYIDKSIVPFEVPEVDTIRYSCLSYFFNSTTVKPSFW